MIINDNEGGPSDYLQVPVSLGDVIDLVQRPNLPHGVVRVGVDGDDGEVVQFCQLTSDVILT